MYNIELQWKEFNVNLEAMLALAKSLDANCTGTSANSKFEIHFLEEPTQEVKDQLISAWEAIDEDSEEATSYKSKEDIQAEVQAKRESAKAKLALLGLTEDEVNALLG